MELNIHVSGVVAVEHCAPSLPAVLPRPAGCKAVCPSARRVVVVGSVLGSQWGWLGVGKCMVNRWPLHMPPSYSMGLAPCCLGVFAPRWGLGSPQ